MHNLPEVCKAYSTDLPILLSDIDILVKVPAISAACQMLVYASKSDL